MPKPSILLIVLVFYFIINIKPRKGDVAEFTEAELNAELEKGYSDMVAGKTKPAR